MKLAVILNQHKLSGRLTKIATGCYAYHVAWVDEETSSMYDMHLIRRCRPWPHYPEAQVVLFDVPQVTREYLEYKNRTDDSTYGFIDYCLFAIRPLFHLFGKSTRNAGGIICSEMVNNDMRLAGIETPWEVTDEPPSPCDIYRWIKDRA